MPTDIEEITESEQENSFYDFIQEEEATERPKRRRKPKTDIPPADRSQETAEAGPKQRRISKREGQLRDAYFTIGLVLTQVNPVDGQLVLAGAEARAKEVADLAKKYPEFGKWIDRALTGNVWIAFGMGHGMLAYAIADNHGLIPPSFKQRVLRQAPVAEPAA